jgi:AcrR family transcriptional regulator
MTHDVTQAERILDRALELGEASSWESLRLHMVADSLQLSLNDIRACYPQKDNLVEAWFDRADQAALASRSSVEFFALPPQARLATVIMAWLDALAPHRRLTRGMLGYKLEPGHFHLQALGVMRISRTVQWFMETAELDVRGLHRIAAETCLTAVYLVTFARWLYDDSPGSQRTRHFLDNTLQRQEKCLDSFFNGGFCRQRTAGQHVDKQPAHATR